MGIVLCEELKVRVLAVERSSDRVMRVKLEIEGEVWNVISCYAPQTRCTEYEKYQFWETIDSEMQAVKRSERLVVAGDLSGHVGSDRIGYEEVHGGHGVGAPNEDGIKVLVFATAYQMRILNTSYQKRKNHLVTYSSGGRENQIDYIMLRKEHANATGEVLMKDDEIKERWGQYFNMLMNKESQRVETEERDPNQAMTRNISEEET